ncbi:SpoIIE family protein phosphatase [Paenibacillus chungangensis]|uniref:SpoIIE family protein phosphatase n=1 Tax=Paenibacillus chungangensis TaxID=696535 RepID=A0ABW3HP12_9BACL
MKPLHKIVNLHTTAIKCYVVYVMVALVAVCGMLLSNKYVSHASAQQFKQTVMGIVAGYLLLLLVLILYTYFRLHSATKRSSDKGHHLERHELWRRFSSFPNELFWLYVITGWLIAQTYRLFVSDWPSWPHETAIQAWRGILFDSSTFLALGIIQYSLARWICSSELKRLNIVHLPNPRFIPLSNEMMAIVICGLLYMQLRLFWYVYQGVEYGSSVQWGVYIAIAFVVGLVTLMVVKTALSYLIGDIGHIKRNILQLEVNQANRLTPIPIVSPYEAGELALAFNRLQNTFNREYSRMKEEIDLARNVQKQLFSPVNLSIGQWKIKAGENDVACASGTFFHLIRLNDQRAVMLGGAIAGSELSAALVMSALLMMFRAQVNEHVSAEQLTHYLKQHLITILAKDMQAHIAVMTLDTVKSELEWTLSGQIRLQLVYEDGLMTETDGKYPINPTIAAPFTCGSYSLGKIAELQLQQGEHTLLSSRRLQEGAA